MSYCKSEPKHHSFQHRALSCACVGVLLAMAYGWYAVRGHAQGSPAAKADQAENQDARRIEGMIRSVAFSPDGKTLAVGHGYGNTRLWDVATQKNTATLLSGYNQPACGVMSVTWSVTKPNAVTTPSRISLVTLPSKPGLSVLSLWATA